MMHPNKKLALSEGKCKAHLSVSLTNIKKQSIKTMKPNEVSMGRTRSIGNVDYIELQFRFDSDLYFCLPKINYENSMTS